MKHMSLGENYWFFVGCMVGAFAYDMLLFWDMMAVALIIISLGFIIEYLLLKARDIVVGKPPPC